MDKQEIRDIILETVAISLEAQLRAVRKLRAPRTEIAHPKRGMSQIDMALDILNRAGQPLHVTKIIERIETIHGLRLDRESLVSALSKRVQRDTRLVRTNKNTFAWKGIDT